MNCRRRESIVKGAMDLMREDLGPLDPMRPKPKPMTDAELVQHYIPLAVAFLDEKQEPPHSSWDVELMAGILMMLDGREQDAVNMLRGLLRGE